MPQVMNCRRCGKIFTYTGGMQVCTPCRQQDEEEFKRIKEYLYENPGATLSEISNVLNIRVEKIKRYLKEGRLEILGSDGNMFLECESCGKAIRTGRLCDDCERDLMKNLTGAADDMKQSLDAKNNEKRSAGLRYLNKNEGKQDIK